MTGASHTSDFEAYGVPLYSRRVLEGDYDNGNDSDGSGGDSDN